MTGSFWWDLMIGVVSALLLAWLALVIALAILRPRGGLLREAVRVLPDVLRLVRRLAAEKTLPRGIRIRLGLLLAYLALPIDLIPDFVPISATPTTPSSSPPSCVASSAAPASTPYARIGREPTADSPRWPDSPVSPAQQQPRRTMRIGPLLATVAPADVVAQISESTMIAEVVARLTTEARGARR